MEFSINIDYPLNIIKAVTPAEKKMLGGRLLQTKLSYREEKILEDVHGEIYEGNIFSTTKDGLRVAVPSLMQDVKRASYYIRMTLDANAVKNGCLPLHAAALTNNGITQFIFAKTGKGKSFTLDTLLSYSQRIIPIGDDHIVIGRDKIAGNRIMRTRERDGGDKDYSVLHGGKVSLLGHYEIILIDVTAKNKNFEIGEVDLVEKDVVENDVLKYLSRKPYEPELEKIYNSVASAEVLEKYYTHFDKFMNGAERVLKLSGEKDYLLEKLIE